MKKDDLSPYVLLREPCVRIILKLAEGEKRWTDLVEVCSKFSLQSYLPILLKLKFVKKKLVENDDGVRTEVVYTLTEDGLNFANKIKEILMLVEEKINERGEN